MPGKVLSRKVPSLQFNCIIKELNFNFVFSSSRLIVHAIELHSSAHALHASAHRLQCSM